MNLSKVSHKNGHTYIVIRARNGEYCTITLGEVVSAEMNKNGTALSVTGQTMPAGQIEGADETGIDMVTKMPDRRE